MQRCRMRTFKVGRKMVKLWRWLRSRSPARRRRCVGLGWSDHEHKRNMAIAKLCSWGRRLGDKLRRPMRLSGYARLEDGRGEASVEKAAVAVPKGHLAVYVGQEEDDHHRYLVPVFYFNHPLFGQLLKEAEMKFGFHRPGGIFLPCRAAEFESVRTKIAACDHSCKRKPWKRRF